MNNLNNSPVSLNEDEIDSSRAMHSRFTLQIEKPPSYSDILSNIPLRKLIDTWEPALKKNFNEILILHSQLWRDKGGISR